MKKYLGIISIVWFAMAANCTYIYSQSLSASVNKNPVATGEQFQITFSLNTSGTNFQGPSFSDFYVLGGPAQSTNMSIINGSVSQTISYTYYLQAKAEGTFKIGSASIIFNGKKLESPPFSISVVKGNPRTQGNPQQQQNSGEADGVSGNDVFLKAIVSKTNVYRGESLVVTYKLYTKVQLVNYSIKKAPALNGFWSQDIQLPAQLDLKSEIINGIQYGAGEIKKVVLFPQQSGTLTLDPMEGECYARIKAKSRRSNDPFDIFNDPFFGMGVRDVKLGVRSDPVKITVKELPPGAPESFNGTVGKFEMTASLDKKQTKANDPVTLKIKISGKGNISLIDPPKINFPPDLETYDPKISENISTNISGSSGSKTFEYLIIPRHEGNFRIDPVEFSYFDLEKKNYVSFASSIFDLLVEKGSGDNAPALTGSSKADVLIIGKDIRFIKTGPVALINSTEIFYGSNLFYLLLLLPFLLIVLLFMIKKYKDKRNSNIVLVKRSKANKMARKRLSIAQKMLNEKKNSEFYDEIFKALWGYISDKLGIQQSDLSKDVVVLTLKQKNTPDEIIDKLITTLDYCEFARFASASANVSPQGIYSDAINIITRLENELK